MSNINGLIQKREELKQHIDNDKYRSLADVIFDWTGRIIYKFTRRLGNFIYTITRRPGWSAQPTSPWYNGTFIALITVLIGLGITAILRESPSPAQVLLSLWAVALGGSILITNKLTMEMFLGTLRSSTLDAIESETDLGDLDSWLKANLDIRKPLVLGVILGPLAGALLFVDWYLTNHETLNIGPVVVVVLALVQVVTVMCHLYPFYVSLPARLSRYRFKLYTVDPSSSEVLYRLSALMTTLMYITTGYVLVVSVSLALFRLLTTITLIVVTILGWVPAVTLFVSGQQSLSRVINRAKWQTLNDLQSQIELLQAQTNIPDKATLDQLDKLMDYHDRIKNTPDSTVNMGAALRFATTLLLSGIPFVLSNYDTIVRLLTNQKPAP